MANIEKSLKVAKKLNIKVKFTDNETVDIEGISNKKISKDFISRGSWPGHGKTIYINKKHATNYTVLHEIGHVLNGLMCCREHCEYAAHGAAIALARENKIKLGPFDKFNCDCYAGRSSHKACGAIDLHKANYSTYEDYSQLKSTTSKVTKVLDNATFMIENQDKPLVIKGIKPIEKGTYSLERWLKEKKKLEKLILGKEIMYKWIQTDVHKRKVCNIFIETNNKFEKRLINKEMKK